MMTLSLPGSRGLISRRQMMAVGRLSLLSLPDFLRGQAAAASAGLARPSSFGKAKSCVIVFLKGGPSQLDTFDMKPNAPAEIRGEFSPIPTNVPGIQICEHLPKLAQQADKYTIVRSMVLSGDAAHSTAAYEMTTGHKFPRSGEAVSSRADHPHFGAVVAAASGRDVPAPPYVMLPDYLVVNGEHRGGQYAGLLGSRFDPFTPGGDPRVLVMGEFGRTPRINPDAGRDHWPNCFSLLMGGAGIPGGHVYGASDAQAAYPTSAPLTPVQLAATVFHALGIDPATTLTAFDGRPYRICEDAPALGLWG